MPRRAKKAKKAIRSQYQNHPSRLVPEDIIDILADIRHLCDERGFCLGDLDRSAYNHYVVEK
jgi:hypothetical protein